MAREQAFEPDWVSSPGETVADILTERHVLPLEFAKQMGYDAETIIGLLHGRTRVTKEIACALAVHLGSSASFWLQRESQYRQDLARLGRKPEGATGREWLRELPLKDMMRFGWLQRTADPSAQTAVCLDFFDVSDEHAWRETYRAPLEMAAFRTSSTFDSHLGAVAAWLRKGELEARAIECEPWNEQLFRALLPRLRPLTRKKDPKTFIRLLTESCASCGVAVVVLRVPEGCRASGATRFLSPEKALLLLSFRYLSDDHFWFTFFHEAGHLLLHSKATLFLESIDMHYDADEKEANWFSESTLIPNEFREEFRPTATHTSRCDPIREAY